jgi:hypothetical protein
MKITISKTSNMAKKAPLLRIGLGLLLATGKSESYSSLLAEERDLIPHPERRRLC